MALFRKRAQDDTDDSYSPGQGSYSGESGYSDASTNEPYDPLAAIFGGAVPAAGAPAPSAPQDPASPAGRAEAAYTPVSAPPSSPYRETADAAAEQPGGRAAHRRDDDAVGYTPTAPPAAFAAPQDGVAAPRVDPDSTFGPDQLTELVNGLGLELYRAFAAPGSAPQSLTSVMEFDEHQRIVGILGTRVDGLPQGVDNAVLGRLGQIAAPLVTAPEAYRLAAVEFEVGGGRLNTRIHYRSAHADAPAAGASPAAQAVTPPVTRDDGQPQDASGQPATDSYTQDPSTPTSYSTGRHAAPEAALPQTTERTPSPTAAQAAAEARSERPAIVIDRLELGPDDLGPQLPIRAELVSVMPGDDRPDYCLAIATPPLRFALPEGFDPARFDPRYLQRLPDGRIQAQIPFLVLAARFVGTQIAPDMKDLSVNLAYVIDNSLTRDDRIDFAKLHYAAVARINRA